MLLKYYRGQLSTKVYKKFKNLNIQNSHNPVKKWIIETGRHLSMMKYKWPKTMKKKISSIISHQRIQIKTRNLKSCFHAGVASVPLVQPSPQ